MPPITDGAALVRALKASGTGDAKVAFLRTVLQDAHRAGRRAPADEVVDALEADGRFPGTLVKAKALRATGALPVASTGADGVHIEDLLAGDDADPAPFDSAPAADREGRNGQLPAPDVGGTPGPGAAAPATHPVTGGNPPPTPDEAEAKRREQQQADEAEAKRREQQQADEADGAAKRLAEQKARDAAQAKKRN